MEKVKEDLLRILNQALELEHTARIQYSTRSEMITAVLAQIERAHKVKWAKDIIEINLRNEKEAIVFYREIHSKVGEYRSELQDAYERLEAGIRNVINGEQRYLDHLASLVDKLEGRVERKRHYIHSNEAEDVYNIKG